MSGAKTKSWIGGVHHLVSGLNGHGKTLLVVCQFLRPLVGEFVEFERAQVRRRLCVSGIKGLALEHEVIDAPPMDPERPDDKWATLVREPGDPPLDVHHQVQNWWAWCMPGDVIAIDECQRVFRPMAAGRRIPMYIEKLETARHYGVQFLYITQHPGRLHTNVRTLIGPHDHVTRMLGGIRTCVYQWPVCTNPDHIRTATKRFWKHDKSGFGLYESAQLHTQFKQRLPAAVGGLVLGLAALVGIGYVLKDRLFGSKASVPAAVAGPGGPATGPQLGGGLPGQRGSSGPLLAVSAPIKDREPYAGMGVHLAGSYQVGQVTRAWYTLSVQGRAVATIRDQDVQQAGYAVRQLGPCSAVFVFGNRERSVVCDVPHVEQERRTAAPGAAASAPS